MLRQSLSTNAPYVLGHTIDREGDNFVESYVVHSPNIGLVRRSCGVMSCYVPDPTLAMSLVYEYKLSHDYDYKI